ncbi:unnamed protein product, partial [Ilex paraguariensis]
LAPTTIVVTLGPADIAPAQVPPPTSEPPSVLVSSSTPMPQADALAANTLSASIDELFRDIGGGIGGDVNGPPPA